MKLLDQVTIKRPETCEDCPFSAHDADEGALCCGYLRDRYMYKQDGNVRFKRVKSPSDAYEHIRFCMFVKRDEKEWYGS
jgi:hypothetical protein